MRMLKRFLLTMFLILLCPTAVHAEEYGDFTYDYRDDGTIQIVGYDGDAEVLEIPATINGVKVTSIAGGINRYVKKIVMPDTITHMSSMAFKGHGMEEIVLSNSLESIPSAAFDYCERLKSITIPDSVKVINDYAFLNCHALEKVVFGKNVKEIGIQSFALCHALKEVVLPDSVETIEGAAFKECRGLERVVLSRSLSQMQEGVFMDCTKLKIVEVTGTAWMNRIPNKLFYNCTALQSFSIANNCTMIEREAFFGCKSLTQITIPEGVTDILDSAFEGCSGLKSLTIPKSVYVIYSGAFRNCTGLTEVTFPNNDAYSYEYCHNGESFYGITNTNRAVNYSYNDTNVLGNDLNGLFLYEESFAGCTSLKELYFPFSLYGMGERAFANCSSLNRVVIENEHFKFQDAPNAIGSQVTISAKTNTTAHKYAQDHGNPFESTGSGGDTGNGGGSEDAGVWYGWLHEGDKSYWYEDGVRQGYDPNNPHYRGKEIYDPESDAWYWLDNVQQGAKAVSKDVYQESDAGPWAECEDGTGKWVRYDEAGHMIKGWHTTVEGTYYFDLIYGTMAKGQVWIEGQEYFFDPVTGIQQGAQQAVEFGWLHIDGKSYWYENGVRQGYDPNNPHYRGKEIYDPESDAWYWLDNVQQGAKAVSKDVYQESDAGPWAEREDGTGKWVRYDAEGHMIKGWHANDDGLYYFDLIYGTMAKGRVTIDNTEYYFNPATGILEERVPEENDKEEDFTYRIHLTIANNFSQFLLQFKDEMNLVNADGIYITDGANRLAVEVRKDEHMGSSNNKVTVFEDKHFYHIRTEMNATRPQTNYTLVIPANSFVNANNEPNEEIRYQFTTVSYPNVVIRDIGTGGAFWWNGELFDLGNGQYRYFQLENDGIYDCIADKNGVISQKKLFETKSDASKDLAACQLENGDYVIRYASKYFYRYKTDGSVEYIGSRADLSGGTLYAIGNKVVTYNGRYGSEYRYFEITEDNTITSKNAWKEEYGANYLYERAFKQSNGNLVVLPWMLNGDEKILIMDRNQNVLRTYASPCTDEYIFYAREYDNQLMILCQCEGGILRAHYLSPDGSVIRTETIKEFTDEQIGRSLTYASFEVHQYETGFAILYATTYVNKVEITSESNGTEYSDMYSVVEFYDNSCNFLYSYTFTSDEYIQAFNWYGDMMEDVITLPNGANVIVSEAKAYIFN